MPCVLLGPYSQFVCAKFSQQNTPKCHYSYLGFCINWMRIELHSFKRCGFPKGLAGVTLNCEVHLVRDHLLVGIYFSAPSPLFVSWLTWDHHPTQAFWLMFFTRRLLAYIWGSILHIMMEKDVSQETPQTSLNGGSAAFACLAPFCGPSGGRWLRCWPRRVRPTWYAGSLRLWK